MAKTEAIRDKVLFIDARNYYTVVDRTLNEWTPWQLKNLNAIVWLYRGETEEYRKLLELYRQYIFDSLVSAKEFFLSISDHDDPVYADFDKAIADFAGQVDQMQTLSDSFGIMPYLDRVYSSWKDAINSIFDDAGVFARINARLALKKRGYKNAKAFKKQQIEDIESGQSAVYANLDAIKEAQWLYEKFGEGKYRDVPGLCKAASIDDIENKGWSLTPGAYVGVAPDPGDGVDFRTRMAEIHAELHVLQVQSNELMETISRNMKEMGI